MMRFQAWIQSLPFIVICGMCVTVTCLDIYVPAMPLMQDYFGCEQEAMQFSVTAAMLGSALGTLFLGPLSDSFGRKKFLVASQSFFALSCLAMMLVSSVEVFNTLRFLNAVAGGGAMVLGIPVFTDVYGTQEGGKYIAYATTAITSSFIAAPILGGVFATYLSWQFCFLFLGTLASFSAYLYAAYLPETLKERQPFSLKRSAQVYKETFSHRRFMILSIIPSLMIAGNLAFVTTGSFFYQQKWGLTANEYGFCQSFVLLTNTAVNFFAGRLMERFGLKNIQTWGLLVVWAGALVTIAVCLAEVATPITLTAAVGLFSGGVGLAFAPYTAEAMAAFPKASGVASSVMAILRTLILAGGISFAMALYNDTALSIALNLNLIAMACVVCFLIPTRPSDSVKVSR